MYWHWLVVSRLNVVASKHFFIFSLLPHCRCSLLVLIVISQLLTVPVAVSQLRKRTGRTYVLLWILQPRLPFVSAISSSYQTKPASLVQDAFPACLVISHRPSPYRPHPLIGMARAKTSRPSTLRKVVSHSPDGSLWKSSQGNV